MRVISLGWGVQSFTLAVMSALGELPQVHAAIHADTTHERSETYEFARKWTPWLEERDVRVVTVSAPERVTDVMRGVTPPYYTLGVRGAGQLRRICTDRWKIRPIRRWLQANRNGHQIEQWIGITLDEVERARLSDVKYIRNMYPFLEMDRPMRRGDVIRWLQEHDLEVPVKSGCVMCPYHDRATWRQIQRSGNGDWQRAVQVDAIIRHKRPSYICYLFHQLKPLVDCDFSSQEDHGQLQLWSEECSGYCFV